MAPTCCILRRLCSCLGSSSSVLQFRPFSTSSVKDLANLAESAAEKSVPFGCYRDQPFLPVPDGFPFSIKEIPRAVEFVRQDKDERTQICLDMNAYRPLNENMLRIRKATMSERRRSHLKCYEEILDSKGIDTRKIFDFFKKQKKENMSING